MTEVRIFESKKTLEVTKTFAKAASRYGSEAYMKLRSARNDYPDYQKHDSQKADLLQGTDLCVYGKVY